MKAFGSDAYGIETIVVRIFISSPGDVEPERAAVGRAVERLKADAGIQSDFELIRWEDDYYTADSTFQEQIVKSSDCDIVICIFWKRLGSPLPDQYRRADGTNPTGTEFEFETAIEAATTSESRLPSLLVYRKTTEVFFSERDLDMERDQFERFKAFWAKWFRNEKAHFTAGFHSFDELAPFEAMIEDHIRKWLQDQTKEVVWTQGSPFAGLAPFDADRAAVFFGRSVDTDIIRARFIANAVAGAKFLLVQGPSGSGKSSLVKAGLVPRLNLSDPVTGIPSFEFPVDLTPSDLVAGGSDWQSGLSERLFASPELDAALAQGDFPNPAALVCAIDEGSAGVAALRGALNRMTSAAAQPVGLLLVLDQLEEVFDWPEPQATAFLEFLQTLLSETPTYVVATMRSEYQHRAVDLGPFAALLGLSGLRNPQDPIAAISLSVPKAADLREMIVAPAEAAGLMYEGAVGDHPPLDRRIEGAARATALPALQLLLSELYERRNGMTMTHKAYDELGGVSGVMANRGEAVLSDCSEVELAAFPVLARRLVRAGGPDEPAVSNRLTMSALEVNPAAKSLARKLMDAGLITGDETTLRIAHEMLIGSWDRLRDFVSAERRFLVVRDRLLTQYRAYLDADRNRAALLVGLQLDEAVELRDVWGTEELEAQYTGLVAFVNTSMSVDKRKRALRALVGVAAIALIALTGWFFFEQQRASAASQVRAELLASSAELRNKRPGYRERTALHAQAALSALNSPETLAAGIAALMVQPPEHRHWKPSPGIEALAYRGDGRILSIDSVGALYVDEERFGQVELDGDLTLALAPLGADGFVIVTTSGRIGIVKSNDGQEAIMPFWTEPQQQLFLARPDQVAILSEGTKVTVWIASGGQKGPLNVVCDLSGPTTCVSKSMEVLDGTTTISSSAQNNWFAQVSRNREQVFVFENDDTLFSAEIDEIRSIAFYGSGMRLGIGRTSSEVVLFGPFEGLRGGPALRANSGTNLRSFVGSRFPILFQAPSPTGDKVAIPCSVGKATALCVIDLTSEAIDVLSAATNDVRTATWSSDGSSLSALHWDGSVNHWGMVRSGADAPLILALPDPLTSVASDLGTGRIAVGTAAGTVMLMGADVHTTFKLGSGPVEHLAFGPDGALAVAHANQIALIEDASIAASLTSDAGGFSRVAHLSQGGIAGILAADGMEIWADRDAVLAGSRRRIDGYFGGVLGGTEGAVLVSAPRGDIQQLAANAEAFKTLSGIAEDGSAGRSLDLHANGRDIAVTRSDGGARIYDLTGDRAAIVLPIAALDTNVVRFSPDGSKIAVLSADGFLHIWDLDMDRRSAELRLSMQPVPDHFLPLQNDRPTAWIDWHSGTEVLVATKTGALLRVPIDADLVEDQLTRVVGAE